MADNDLINGLGGSAGFGTNSSPRNDDGYTPGISLTSIFGPSGVRFGETNYTEFFINNNGMITFEEGIGGFTPNGLSAGVDPGDGYVPAIALFWTDIDTRSGNVPVSPGGNSSGTNLVYWHEDAANDRFIITWDDTGVYPTGTTPVVAGQIILTDAGNGNMNIEFRYEYAQIGRDTAAGWNVGTGSGVAGRDYFEIPGENGTSNHSDLDTRVGNSGLTGVWRWYLRDGVVNDTAGSVNFSVNTLAEAGVNDGTISSSVIITVDGDQFTGNNGDNLLLGGKVSVSNVPAGLTATLIRSDATTAVLALTGTALSHDNVDDISNLVVTFNDAAFAGNNAAILVGAAGTQLNVDFSEPGNQAPVGVGDLTLAAVDEDTAEPAGTAIAGLAGFAFDDPDSGAAFAGIAVQNNSADSATEGRWQYSSDAGDNWHDLGVVSETQALALSAATLLRFVPAADYFGTPGGLVVRAMDESASFFTNSGATESRVIVNAALNGASSPIAATTNTVETTVNPVNDAPVITGGGTATYVEGDPAVASGTSMALVDVDNTSLASATVSISANFQSDADVLAFVNDNTSLYGNIAATYDADSGVLTLNSSGASASLVQWQQALAAVTYSNTSDDPSSTARTLSVVVNDSALDSQVLTSTVNVTPVNDAPVITNLAATAAGDIGSPVRLNGEAVAVLDPDSANFADGHLEITISEGASDGSFLFDGLVVGVGVDSASADAEAEAGETVFVDGIAIGTVNAVSNGQNGEPLRIEFSANATPALTATLLQNIFYRSDSAGGRTFEIGINDGDGSGSNIGVVTLNLTRPADQTTDSIEGVPARSSTITTDDNRTLDVLDLVPVPQNRPGFLPGSNADIALYYGDSAMDIPATRASLPTGVGLVSTGLRIPTSNADAVANLIYLINQAAGSTESTKDMMLGGGESFLDSLYASSERGLLIVNSITLRSSTDYAGSASNPIVIRGTADELTLPNVDNGVPVEALVIDARQLPAGSVIVLENIEFAVIVGDHVTVRGGAGANVLFAGAGSQNIVLGADDDELHGGDGDDVVGSLGGNDLLFGDAGNDRLVGGTGDDVLHGGDGDDILAGGRSDAGDWEFALGEGGVIDGRFTPELPDLAMLGEDSLANTFPILTLPAGQGRIDSRLGFTEHAPERLSDIALLHHIATGALPTTTSLQAYASLNVDAAGLAQLAVAHMGLDTTPADTWNERLDELQQQALGQQNDVLTQQGLDHLNQDGSWAHLLLALVRHDLHREGLVDEQGNLPLALTLTVTETGWQSDAGNDMLYGGDGNDLLVGGRGNNLLDGGAGMDMASFFGSIHDYAIGLHFNEAASALDVLVLQISTGDLTTLRDIELGRIGNEIYHLREDRPTLGDGEFNAAIDMVALVGNADLAALDLPDAWLV